MNGPQPRLPARWALEKTWSYRHPAVGKDGRIKSDIGSCVHVIGSQMSTIILEGIGSMQDLLFALSAVTKVFTDPESFETETHTFTWHGFIQADQAECEETRVRTAEDSPQPVPYVACPRRGTHVRLADCWLCWSDVMRSASLEVDVLSPVAWDLSLARLVALSSQEADPIQGSGAGDEAL